MSTRISCTAAIIGLALSVAAVASGCSDDEGSPAPDTTADTADTPDAASDTGTPIDTHTTDVGPVEPVTAIEGARCERRRRIGLVTLFESYGSRTISAELNAAPHPWFGTPQISAGGCQLFQFQPGGCGGCSAGELCGVSGSCEPAPTTPANTRVGVSSEAMPVEGADASTTIWAGKQEFSPFIGDGVALAANELSMRLLADGLDVVAPRLAMPSDLEGPSVEIAGGYDAPTSVTATWTAPAVPHQVSTHIDINHHASGPTYTTCAVDAASGTMVIEQDMLTPLAVSTGLEFQGIEHTRFAAAELPAGCVEFRWSVRANTQ